jgi:pyrroline-5-carboxylate reductase
MIAVLGAGNLGEAIASVAARDHDVVVTCRRPERAIELRARGLRVADGIADIAAAELAIIGVRHDQLAPLIAEVRPVLAGKLVVSLVIGAPSELLERALPDTRVIRAVPNIAARVRASVTVLAPGASATTADLVRVRALFAALGDVVELPEDQLAAANAISGAGIAYVYVLVRALARAGVAAGLPDAAAATLAAGALSGAARLAPTAPLHDLLGEIAGPGGSTAAALSALEAGGFDALVTDAVAAAIARARARDAEAHSFDCVVS